VFLQLSEKQLVVLSNQPVVLLLGVFEKVENYLSFVDLTAKQNNRLFCGFNVLWFQPIVSLKILTEFCFGC